MNRTDIINFYLDRISSPKFYLEIGVSNPANNFDKIRADIKHGVNPPNKIYQYTHTMTSDEFFSINKCKYNVIFIDGLHTFEQSYKDFLNSEKFIKENGVIVMHDCNPTKEDDQLEKAVDRTWTGTVWKTFVKLRCERDDLEMYVIDCDWGVGIIKKGKQKLFKLNENIFDYEIFDKYRKDALNLINIEDWKKNET